MNTTTLRNLHDELGERAYEALLMENKGTAARRSWWVVSSYVVASCDIAA